MRNQPPAESVVSAMAARDTRNRPKSYAVGLRAALSQGQPGGWQSDHLAESERFTGWHYVSTHTLCLQGMRASVYVFDDSRMTSKERSRMRSLRKAYRGKHGLRKAVESGNAGEPLGMEHPLVRLLSRPSPTQSGASFRYEQILQLELTGNCYIWKVPNRAGRTVERYVIPTAILTPRQPGPGLPTGGMYVSPAMASQYSRSKDGDGFVEGTGWRMAIGSVIPMEQMQVIRWPHPLVKDDGYSPMSACALWTDTSEMIDKSRWGHLKRGPDPSLFLTLSDEVEIQNESELDRLSAKIEARLTGEQNRGRAMIGAGIKDAKTLTTAPKEMAYDTGFTQMRDAIMAIRGVGPIAAGIQEGGSYAAFYAALRGFAELSIAPRLALMAEEDTEQLAIPEFGDGVSVEMEPANIDDPTLMIQQVAAAGEALTRDEVRDILFGMHPLKNGEGEELMGSAAAQGGIPMRPEEDAKPTSDESGATGQPGVFDKFLKSQSRLGWFDRVASKAFNGNGKH